MPSKLCFLIFVFWNLQYLIEVLKYFSRLHLIAKCIKFRIEVRTRLFFCMIIVKRLKFVDLTN